MTTQIQLLEQELGLPLFDRLGKRIALTPAGEILLEHARALVRGAENAKLAVQQPGPPRGKLRLGSLPRCAAGRCHILLRRYHERYPQVDLQMQTGGWNQLARQLNAGGLDLVWLLGEGPVPGSWAQSCSGAHPLQLAAAPGSPWASPGPVPPARLSVMPFLFTEQGCPYRAVFENFCALQGLQPHVFLETDSTTAILNFALSGLGVALLPGFCWRGPRPGASLCRCRWRGLRRWCPAACSATPQNGKPRPWRPFWPWPGKFETMPGRRLCVYDQVYHISEIGRQPCRPHGLCHAALNAAPHKKRACERQKDQGVRQNARGRLDEGFSAGRAQNEQDIKKYRSRWRCPGQGRSALLCGHDAGGQLGRRWCPPPRWWGR